MPPELQKPLDPKIIRSSPLEPPPQDFDQAESDFYLEIVADLSEQNAALKAENDRLKGEQDFNRVKASLIAPYSNKVFSFLCIYCLGVFLLILGSGQKFIEFNLAKEVLVVLSGSTAVAAIGLVGIVVKGLFARH